MALLIALVNIIGWGLIPLTVKDSPQSQIAGMGIGASAGFQLVGNSLIGVLIFGEWPTAHAKVIGFIALALVVIGIVLSSKSDDKGSGDANAKNIALLLITTIGFWIYSSFPKLIAKDINPGVNGLDYILNFPHQKNYEALKTQ